MYLPESVLFCIQTLEHAGFAAYAVGGCVRDSLLGLTPHDYDLCTNALPEQTAQCFEDHRQVTAGKKHGTIGVVFPDGVVEITTFRTEGDYRDGRHPNWVAFVPDIREDLARRDFTVNAMAYSPTRGFADPFGGRADLERRILRTGGDPAQRFREDALRILRGVRFSAVYHLTPEEHTLAAMNALAATLDKISAERIFSELDRLLPAITLEQMGLFAPVLAAAIPELAPMIGFDQRSPYHAFDLYTHTAHVVAGVPADPALRWAALLHDVGKIPTFTQDDTGRGHFRGHAQESAKMADGILRRLKAPNDLREQAIALVDGHMSRLEPDKKLLRRRISRYGMEMTEKLLLLQKADMSGKGRRDAEEAAAFDRIDDLFRELKAEDSCLTLRDLAINGNDLIAIGCRGKEIGDTLNALLSAVLDERLPNTREALLKAAQEIQLSRKS